MPVIDGKVEGLYVLNDNENGYVWAHGPWPVKVDDAESDQGD